MCSAKTTVKEKAKTTESTAKTTGTVAVVVVAVFAGGEASVDGGKVVAADDSVGNEVKGDDRRKTKRKTRKKDQKKGEDHS